MVTLHDHHRMHLIAVFPKDSVFMEMQRCYQEAQSTTEWMTVTTEDRLDRNALDSEENFIVFFKALPPWIPLKTEATIGLFFMGYAVNDPRDNERAWKFFQEWKKTSMRADVIFVRDPDQQAMLTPYSRNTINLANGFYHPKIMGAPVFPNMTSENPFYTDNKKQWLIASYGDPFGRREGIIRKLKETIPNGYIHVPSITPDERRKLLANTRIALHIRAAKEDESFDPFFGSEVIASNAMMVLEIGSRWPFDDEGDQCYRISLDGPIKETAERLCNLAARGSDCMKVSRRAFTKFSTNMTVTRTCEQLLANGASSFD